MCSTMLQSGIREALYQRIIFKKLNTVYVDRNSFIQTFPMKLNRQRIPTEPLANFLLVSNQSRYFTRKFEKKLPKLSVKIRWQRVLGTSCKSFHAKIKASKSTAGEIHETAQQTFCLYDLLHKTADQFLLSTVHTLHGPRPTQVRRLLSRIVLRESEE